MQRLVKAEKWRNEYSIEKSLNRVHPQLWLHLWNIDCSPLKNENKQLQDGQWQEIVNLLMDLLTEMIKREH